MAVESKAIKNIIFDLGGVLLNIDYGLTIGAFENLGVTDFEALYSQAKQTELFDSLETGKITPLDFCDGIRSISNRQFSNKEIIIAWNAMLLDLPQERIDFLSEMRKKYRIFLLSNTNQIHLEGFTQIIREQHSLMSLSPLFEEVYYSHEIGVRKPNANAFDYVCSSNRLNVQETLFIDDSIQHVEGARQFGLSAIHLDTTSETVMESLAFLC